MATPVSICHLLQLSGPVDLELAAALAGSVRVCAWEPDRTLTPVWPLHRAAESHFAGQDGQPASLTIHSFPVLRGVSHFPLSRLPWHRDLLKRLLGESPNPVETPLICTTPYFASVAEQWPGPVIYWLSDLIAEYDSADRAVVCRLDRRLCRAATLVCPNSARIAEYLLQDAACDPGKIHILPNGMREANLLPKPSPGPSPLPAEIRDLSRPIAGVMGNMGENVDWVLLESILQLTPAFTWLFVGPTTDRIRDPQQNSARTRLLAHRACRFLGSRPHSELVHYARTVDVAVLPYLHREPTWSGSSTRFYEHLAAGRPIVAFPAVHELLAKVPLLTLAGTPYAAASCLESLRIHAFEDGLASLRWHAARSETWEARAHSLLTALKQRTSALIQRPLDQPVVA